MGTFRTYEMKSILCGDKIGEGINRKVYVCRLDPDWVVKLEPGGTNFQNIEEWRAWEWACGTAKQRWLAPCRYISPGGYVLIQRRVRPLMVKERPKLIPNWLTDIKPEHFGKMDGKVVCVDYGTILCCFQDVPTKMVKARWRE